MNLPHVLLPRFSLGAARNWVARKTTKGATYLCAPTCANATFRLRVTRRRSPVRLTEDERKVMHASLLAAKD